MALEAEGFIVDSANNGKDAIKKSFENFFNLAIVDWRLPDIKEFQSLLTPPKRLTFSDDESLFPNVMNDDYWSSSLYYDFGNPDTEQAWYIHLNSGDINIKNKNKHYVWPVRGNRRWWVENEEK